ncbi:MAG: hypothetical protein KBC64_06405 [Simkaniaceae bacterium]|nr:hypothetical protein [Simkaniaceae bacterium]
MAKYVLLLILFLTACQSKMMTGEDYAMVQIGEPIEQVTAVYGRPYTIHSRDQESEVYEYGEKIIMGTTIISQKRYYLIVKDGRIVGKYSKITNPSPIQSIYANDPYPNY